MCARPRGSCHRTYSKRLMPSSAYIAEVATVRGNGKDTDAGKNNCLRVVSFFHHSNNTCSSTRRSSSSSISKPFDKHFRVKQPVRYVGVSFLVCTLFGLVPKGQPRGNQPFLGVQPLKKDEPPILPKRHCLHEPMPRLAGTIRVVPWNAWHVKFIHLPLVAIGMGGGFQNSWNDLQ